MAALSHVEIDVKVSCILELRKKSELQINASFTHTGSKVRIIALDGTLRNSIGVVIYCFVTNYLKT